MATDSSFEHPAEQERIRSRLAALNDCAAEAASLQFRRCCGSARWVVEMVKARPFSDLSAMEDCADRIWAQCSPSEWLEAFAAHPRIGDRNGGSWSRQEQAGVMRASSEVQTALAQANREYEARFGYIFIVCASGRTPAEMLAILQERLHNRPSAEIRVAAEQQRLITRLRLRKLLSE